MKHLLVITLCALLCTSTHAVKRSSSAKRAFVQEHACPATGEHKTHCPGYVIDHVIPLCAGGPDKPTNMQWQSIEDARDKDVLERRECRTMRESK